MNNLLTQARIAALAAGLLGGLLGLLIIRGLALPLVGAIVAVGLVSLLVKSPGWGVGIWLLITTNTIPVLNIDKFAVSGRFQPQDLLMVALVLAFVVAWLRRGSPLPAGWDGQPIVVVAIVAIAWWLLVFLASWLVAGIPFKLAALYGRSLLYMPLAILCGVGLLRAWRDVRAVVITVMAGASLFALGVVVQTVAGRDVLLIVHPYMVNVTSGITRVYQESQFLVFVSLPLAFWLAMVSRRGPRMLYALLTIVLGAGLIVLLVRASYIEAAVGLLVSIGCALIGVSYRRAGRRAAVLAGFVLVGAILIVIVAAASAQLQQGNSSTTSAASSRADSVIAGVSSRVGSVIGTLTAHSSGATSWSVRIDQAKQMQAMLGVKGWIVGLGFLNPQAHYVVGLPQGSIINDDLGAMEVLMPSGMIGLLLALAPAVLIVLGGFRSRKTATLSDMEQAVVLGSVAFFSGALVASVTLGTLFTSPVDGLFVAVAAILLYGPASEEMPEPSLTQGRVRGAIPFFGPLHQTRLVGPGAGRRLRHE